MSRARAGSPSRRLPGLLATAALPVILVLSVLGAPAAVAGPAAPRLATARTAAAAPAGPAAAVTGTVFDDINGDGSSAATAGLPADPGLSGAGVALQALDGTPAVDAGGVAVPDVTTGPDGGYSFANVASGSYLVSVTAPSGFVVTTPTPDVVTLTGSGDSTGNDVGAQERDARLVVSLVDDRDGSGSVTPADVGLSGVSATVAGPYGESITVHAMDGPAPSFSAAGTVTLTGLVPGAYAVVAVGVPAAEVVSFAQVGPVAASPPGATPIAAINNGYYVPGTVAGQVFDDRNGNGVADAGEPGLDNRSVTVSTHGTAHSATTAADGSWTVTGLPPGGFTVTTSPPAGTVVTTPARSGTLTEGSTVPGVELGTRETDASLSGTVFADDDGSGTRGAQEAGIAGLTVTADNGVDPAGTFTTRTGADGSWVIAGLPGGTYTVTVATPANAVLTTGASPTGGDPVTETLSPGAAGPALLTGFLGPNAAPVFSATANNTTQTVNSGGTPAPLTASDANSDPLTFRITSGTLPTGLTLGADGRFTGSVTNSTGAATSTTVVVQVSDGRGGADSTTLVLRVLPAADAPPTAVNDTADTVPGTAVNVPVLVNDSDPDGDPLSVASYSQGSRGSAVSCTSTTCSYQPAPSVGRGTETFTYVVSDGRGGNSSATVTVRLDNVKPVFALAPANTAQTVTVGSVPVALSAVDPNGDPLHFTLVSGSLPDGVRLTDSGAFTGAARAPGSFVAVASVDDGSPGTPATTRLAITVPMPAPDSPPVANPDSYPVPGQTIVPGVPVKLTVLANDTDVDNDPLTVIAFDDPTRGGRVSLSADGSLTYTADAGFVGVDTFAYTVADGRGGTDVGSVSVEVSAPPDRAPTFTDAPANTSQQIASGASLLPLTATDPDPGTTLTYSLASASGPLPNGVTLQPDGAFSGAPVNASTAQQSFRVTVVVSDSQLIDTSALVIVVDPRPKVDNPPVAVDDAADTAFGQAVTVPVLANDSDPDAGDVLSIAGFDPVSQHGGTVACADAGTGGAAGCTYTPAAGYSGDDSFGYVVSDGTLTASATVTVSVGAPPPTTVRALDDTATTATGTQVSIPVTANDTDSAGLVLSATAGTQPTNGAVTCNGALCVYTPTVGFTGNDTFTYTVSDTRGSSATALVTVSVTLTANVPTVTAVGDAAATTAGTAVTLRVTANDTDSAGLTLSAVPASTPAHGTVSCTAGDCTYTPNAGFSGTDSFTYAVSDGAGGNAVGTASIRVAAPLLAPRPPTVDTLLAGPLTSTIYVGGRPGYGLGGRLISHTGALPPGLSLTAAGTFTGRASRAGTYRFATVIRVEGQRVTRPVVVTVQALPRAVPGASGTTVVVPVTATAGAPASGAGSSAPATSRTLAMTGTDDLGGGLTLGAGLLLGGAGLLALGRRRPARR